MAEAVRPLRIGYAFCGSFCTLDRSLAVMCGLCRAGHEVFPFVSEHVASMDTRFGRAADFVAAVGRAAGRPAVSSIEDAEPFGPKIPLDLLIVAPCTGNTLAKIACGITDSTVTMAVKAHLRRDRPTLIALASNDALSQNLHNLALLLQRKAVFFLPMRQDDPEKKPHSMIAEYERIPEAIAAAQDGRQLFPIFLQ